MWGKQLNIIQFNSVRTTVCQLHWTDKDMLKEVCVDTWPRVCLLFICLDNI